jgi:hypothetical protein
LSNAGAADVVVVASCAAPTCRLLSTSKPWFSRASSGSPVETMRARNRRSSSRKGISRKWSVVDSGGTTTVEVGVASPLVGVVASVTEVVVAVGSAVVTVVPSVVPGSSTTGGDPQSVLTGIDAFRKSAGRS